MNVSTWFWYKSTLKVNVYVHTWLSRFSVFSNLTQRGSHLTSIASKRELHSKPFIKGEFHAFSFKQGQKLVLSDALAVQFQGYQGPKVSSLKVVLGSQKVLWDIKISWIQLFTLLTLLTLLALLTLLTF